MKQLDKEHIRRIMVRVNNWIGDGVMSTPALHAIRIAFPDAEIVVVANPIVAELFRDHPDCDRVVVFDKKGAHKGLGGLLRFARQLRGEGFDLAILFQKAIEAALLALLARIPRRLGFSTDGRGLLLTHRTALDAEVLSNHRARHYLLLLQRFGIEGGSGRQRLQVGVEEESWAAERLGEGRWLAVNPGAAYGSAKRWLPERFAEVADRLGAEYGFRVVLTGGPGEAEIGADIEKAMGSAAVNLVGKTTVRQMMAILSRCHLMVTNDSGPMHVAAALGVPIVAVFGSTDHTTTHPYTDRHVVVRHDVDCAPCMKRQCPTDHRCMEAVSAEDVVSAACKLLEGEGHAQ